MSETNFMLQDIFSTLLGFVIFPLVLIVPGYVVGWVLDLMDFRARSLPSRMAISLLLSFAVSPIFYLMSSLISFTASLVLAAGLFFVFLWMVWKYKPPALRFRNKAMTWVYLSALVWMVIGLFSLVDIQAGNGLFFSVVGYDHTTRISIVDAMTRTGVPPVNPSYYPGHPVLLTSLYFFWYILGSLVDQLGGGWVDARGAFFASAIWSGLAIMVLVAFYLRFRRRTGKEAWSTALIGLGLLLVTGLDFLPATLAMQQIHTAVGDIEHWNEQITAWMGSMLWVPHHLAALVACTTGVILALSMHGEERKRKFMIMAVAGMAFASGIGLSTWVTLVFVLFWGLWILVSFVRPEDRPLVTPMIFAGVVAVLLAAPFLVGVLVGGGEGGMGSAFPVTLEPRAFSIFEGVLASSAIWFRNTVRLILLPVNYFFELGFFLYVGVMWLQENRRSLGASPFALMEGILLGVSFFVGTFVRSTVIENNDLGWRAWLPGQFILLVWGVDVLQGWLGPARPAKPYSPRTKLNLVLLLIFGVVSTLMDLVLLRVGYYFYYGPSIGHEIYSARMTYAALNEKIPPEAVVQYNPASSINRPSGLYGNHQSAISDRSAYGVPLDVYESKVAEVRRIFDMQDVTSWGPVDELCDDEFIDVIVLTTDDRLWHDLDVLAAGRDPLYKDNYFAAFACGVDAASTSP